MAFLRNTWYVALWSQDLAVEQIVARTFLYERIVLFRAADGTVSALEDACPHRFAPLSMGRIENGSTIRCPYHALEFDGSGKCVHNPHGSGQIPAALKVRSYPIVEKHSMIWIWMGDEPADPAKIPDFSVLDPDSGRITSKRDWIMMDASYELVIDNLMDLSHTAVIHEGILGAKHTIKANYTIEQNGTTVKIGRSIPNVAAVGLYDLMYKRDQRPVDLWMDMRWDAPAAMINDTGVTEPGRPRSEGTGFYGMHFLTPETEHTTWYLFAAVRQNPISWGEPLDSEIQTQLTHLRRVAFQDQDQGIIRAQQIVWLDREKRGKPSKPTLLEIDLATSRYKRVLDGLIRDEAARATKPEATAAPASRPTVAAS